MLWVQVLRNFKYNLRNLSTISTNYGLEQLCHRSLIRVSGEDASDFLQGLITNDMKHLSYEAGSMFAMFLNNKGRVLYDTIIYRPSLNNTFYVEIDKVANEILRKHLNVYRLRRKVEIVSVDDELNLWVQFNPSVASLVNKKNNEHIYDDKFVSCSSVINADKLTVKLIDNNEIFIFRDPRLKLLGCRMIVPINCNSKLIESYPDSLKEPCYKWFRYRLGVGEGIEELPTKNCFPLEANCDYLHGISFQKGCYIGQELTARSYHTGVIRKRLMPLFFQKPLETIPEKDEIIKSGDKNVGKLRGYEKDSGLGLLRVNQALEGENLIVNESAAYTLRPNWWPQILSKEISAGNL